MNSVQVSFAEPVALDNCSFRYNSQIKWDRRFLERAKQIASWSKDPSTKVGAVIVNNLGQVVGEGYNGFPRGVEDADERLYDREKKLLYMVHAELNAILLAGEKARGCTLYVWPSFGQPPVCNECCKAVIQAGIVRIVGGPVDASRGPSVRWKDSIEVSRQMCTEAGIELLEVS